MLELLGAFCYATASWLYCWPVVENLIGPQCVFTACWQPLCPTPPIRLYKCGSCLWHYWAWVLRWSVLTGGYVRRETPAVRTRRGDTDAARFQMWVSPCPDHVTGLGGENSNQWKRRSFTKSCPFDPFLQANCCSDHLHCCYEGTVCDLAHSKCVNKTVSLPWVRRLPARQTHSAPQVVHSHLLSLFTVILTVCWPLHQGKWSFVYRLLLSPTESRRSSVIELRLKTWTCLRIVQSAK